MAVKFAHAGDLMYRTESTPKYEEDKPRTVLAWRRFAPGEWEAMLAAQREERRQDMLAWHAEQNGQPFSVNDSGFARRGMC